MYWLECKYCHCHFQHHKLDRKRFLCPWCWSNRYLSMSPRIDPWVLYAHWDRYQHLLHLPGEPLHSFNCICCERSYTVSMFERYKYACNHCYNRVIKPIIDANGYTHEFIINNWQYLRNQNTSIYPKRKRKGRECMFGDNSTYNILKLKFNI